MGRKKKDAEEAAPVTIPTDSPAVKLTNQIKQRHHERKLVIRSLRQLTPPLAHDPEAVNEYTKTARELQKQLLHSSFLVDFDVSILLHTIFALCGRDEKIAADHIWLSEADIKEKLMNNDPRALEIIDKYYEAIAKVEDDKLRGGNKDQKTIFDEMKTKDDGSTAEPASECTTRQLEEGE